ncbi:MAG: GNAT family N-acetyltransferase [Saprospiraceae bacterium]
MAFSSAYRDFIADHPEATVWHDADFLTCLTAHETTHDWSSVELSVDGDLVGILPICTKKRVDGLVITTPPLARYCSPLFEEAYLAKVGAESAICSLLEALPKGYSSLDQQWHPSLFAKASAASCVEVKELPTYKIELPDTFEEVIMLPRKKMRKTLRSATKHWTLRQVQLDEEGIALLGSPFVRQQKPVPYDGRTVLAAYNLLSERGQAVCHYAYDPQGVLQGASVCLADAHTAYCWITGSSDEARDNSCGSFLLSTEVQWAFEKGLKEVDFLGSALPGPAENRRHLGGVLHSYPHVYVDANFMTKALRGWRMR